MSTPAYASLNRRHARHHVRDLNTQPHRLQRKAQVIPLIPRQQKLQETVPQKSVRGALSLAVVVVAAAHLALAWVLNQPADLPITKAEIPPMTVEFYRPPVEQPPEPPQPKDEPPPPEPVVEKPKPVIKKEAPKPVEKKPEPEPVVQEVAVVEPVPESIPEPPPAPVLTKASADAGYLRNPAPRYPDFAQERGWEGTVILNVHVLANGKPKTVEVKQSSGRKVLDDSAVQAVRRWSFVPAKLGDTTVDSWVEVPIDFRLSE